MKISIITPTFNNASFLKGNIDSILDQSYRNVEHIVVDGGSTDGTVELLKSYSHIRWISERDNGMYEAINKGIRIASGQIISYLNADDRYHQSSLQLVNESFEINDKLDFVYGYCTYIDESERAICTFKPVPLWRSTAYKVRITWAQPCCFWRKDIHKKIGLFDGSMRIAGDSDFFRRIILSGARGMMIRKPLASFMARKDCISNILVDNYKKEMRSIEEKYATNPKSWQYLVNEGIYLSMNLGGMLKYQVAKWKNRV